MYLINEAFKIKITKDHHCVPSISSHLFQAQKVAFWDSGLLEILNYIFVISTTGQSSSNMWKDFCTI